MVANKPRNESSSTTTSKDGVNKAKNIGACSYSKIMNVKLGHLLYDERTSPSDASSIINTSIFAAEYNNIAIRETKIIKNMRKKRNEFYQKAYDGIYSVLTNKKFHIDTSKFRSNLNAYNKKIKQIEDIFDKITLPDNFVYEDDEEDTTSTDTTTTSTDTTTTIEIQ